MTCPSGAGLRRRLCDTRPSAEQRCPLLLGALPSQYHQHPSWSLTAPALAGWEEQDLTLPAICLEKDSTSASTP